MSDVERLLTLVNGAALHKALREQGVGVSYRTVARWIGATPSAKPPAELMPALEVVFGTTKEAAPPDWAERLADMAAEAAVTRLVPPDLLEQVPELFQRIEAFLQQVAEDAPEEPGPQGPAGSTPLGRTDE